MFNELIIKQQGAITSKKYFCRLFVISEENCVKKIITFISLALVSASASAVTIDLRHEYTDDSQVQKDRLLISHRFANGFGISIEGKVKSGGDDQDKAFNDVVDNGDEYVVSYQFNAAPGFSVQPGFALETSSSKAIYKPYIRGQYTFENGIYIAGRYRYEYTRDTSADKDDEHINRGDLWLGYKIKAWAFEGNYLYKKSEDYDRFNNGKDDYELNLKVAYSIDKNWKPYVELGNVSVRSTTDERQTRYRVGLQYTF
ncbi:porin [Pseudocitrobacter sp. 73]|nr:porin [Pseudocitrobacter sp. 73]